MRHPAPWVITLRRCLQKKKVLLTILKIKQNRSWFEVDLHLFLSNVVIFILNCKIFNIMVQKYPWLENVPPDPISDLINLLTYALQHQKLTKWVAFFGPKMLLYVRKYGAVFWSNYWNIGIDDWWKLDVSIAFNKPQSWSVQNTYYFFLSDHSRMNQI